MTPNELGDLIWNWFGLILLYVLLPIGLIYLVHWGYKRSKRKKEKE